MTKKHSFNDRVNVGILFRT